MELKDKKILIVDDEAELRNIFTTEFKFYQSQTFEAYNATSAIEILKSEKVDLILSDIRMPGGDGIELLKYVNNNIKPFPYFIMLTGYSDLKKLYSMHLTTYESEDLRLRFLYKIRMKKKKVWVHIH